MLEMKPWHHLQNVQHLKAHPTGSTRPCKVPAYAIGSSSFGAWGLDPINKVEMSAATIAALRSMMREEFKHGMAEMETMLASKIENSVGELRKEIASERDARQHLEERISHLEAKHLNPNMPDSEEDVVDKSMIVIGGSCRTC